MSDDAFDGSGFSDGQLATSSVLAAAGAAPREGSPLATLRLAGHASDETSGQIRPRASPFPRSLIRIVLIALATAALSETCDFALDLIAHGHPLVHFALVVAGKLLPLSSPN